MVMDVLIFPLRLLQAGNLLDECLYVLIGGEKKKKIIIVVRRTDSDYPACMACTLF